MGQHEGEERSVAGGLLAAVGTPMIPSNPLIWSWNDGETYM